MTDEMWEDNFMFHTTESILFGTLLTWLGNTSVIWILCLTEWWISRSMMRSYQENLFIVVWLGLGFVSEWVSWCCMHFKYFPFGSGETWLALPKIATLWQKQYFVAALFPAGLAESPVVDQTQTVVTACSPGIKSLSWGWAVLAWAYVIHC